MGSGPSRGCIRSLYRLNKQDLLGYTFLEGSPRCEVVITLFQHQTAMKRVPALARHFEAAHAPSSATNAQNGGRGSKASNLH